MHKATSSSKNLIKDSLSTNIYSGHLEPSLKHMTLPISWQLENVLPQPVLIFPNFLLKYNEGEKEFLIWNCYYIIVWLVFVREEQVQSLFIMYNFPTWWLLLLLQN